MAVRDIRIFGDPVLKTVCRPIEKMTPQVINHVQDLIDTVRLDGRAGVASNQIGHTLRVFSINIDGNTFVLLNPEIIAMMGEPEMMGEGCLSLPDFWFEVPRHPFVKARGMDAQGEEVIIEGEGLLAQVLQHECDHLNGKLYLDRLDKKTRGEAFRQIRASSWF